MCSHLSILYLKKKKEYKHFIKQYVFTLVHIVLKEEKKNNCFDQRSFMRVFRDASFGEVKNWLCIQWCNCIF